MYFVCHDEIDVIVLLKLIKDLGILLTDDLYSTYAASLVISWFQYKLMDEVIINYDDVTKSSIWVFCVSLTIQALEGPEK